MLVQLHIRNFTIIDSAEIELADGMTSLTGETGAGKSILLDAIGLVLGDRADSATVRPGADRAEINASFQPDASSPVWKWLLDHDLDDEGQCLLRRIVASGGKSRGYVNGRPVTMQTLRSVGEMLVDIHGQHEHYTLTQRSTQRELLDSMAKKQTLTRQVQESYQRWRDVQDRIRAVANDTEQREQRIDMLRFQIQEFDSLNLTVEELVGIEAEHQRSANAGQLLHLANLALHRIDDAELSADAQLNHAIKSIQQLQAIDDSVTDCLEVVNTAAILTQEAASSLRDYISRIDVDSERLGFLDDRLANLHRLAKKHHTDIAGLLDVQHQIVSDLALLKGDGNDIDSLQKECDAFFKVYVAQSEKLTRQRKKSAKALSTLVSSAMHALGMQGGDFQCEVESAGTEPGRHGQDSIRFLVSPNPGMQAGDISKIASGGELSRISLALAMVTSGNPPIPTLIFDEVDSGIGGGVASTVGQYLRKLGNTAQVLCVTHLPQVAAQAHHHLRVSKVVKSGSTSTVLTPLDPDETINEIARMLGGEKVTRKSRQHAVEMLESV